MNEKLNSWVQDISTDATAKSPKDEPKLSQSAATSGAVATSDPVPEPGTDTSRKTKQNFRFARVNALKYDIGESTCLDLTADPGNTRLNYSQTLSSNTKLGVEHRTSDNKTQMLFKYEW